MFALKNTNKPLFLNIFTFAPCVAVADWTYREGAEQRKQHKRKTIWYDPPYSQI